MNISIIVTYYNKNELLINAIDSCIYQLKESDELIIINDKSSSLKSLETIQKVELSIQNKSNIYLYSNTENQGAAESKNIGIDKAKNEIIVLLDADDTLPENSLESLRETFIQTNSDFVFGNYLRKEIHEDSEHIINCEEITTNNIVNPNVLIYNWILLGTTPFTKSIYKKINGFDKMYPRTDDRDFHIKAIMNNAKFVYIDNLIYNWHRYNDGNNSNIPSIDSTSSYFRNIMFYYKFSTKLRFTLVLIKNFLRI